MTVEINIADNRIYDYLSEIERYMANYRGSYPRIHAFICYLERELYQHKQEKKK